MWLQNSQEKPVSESFFNKVARLRRETLLKKRLRRRCFPVNFQEYVFTEHIWVTASAHQLLKTKP